MSDSISRRIFLGGALAATAAAQAPSGNALPTRILGRTGERRSILAFGCGSRWLSYREEDRALEAMQTALDLGINYIDTAEGYGNGLSETRVGKMMPRYRKQVLLQTKTSARSGEDLFRRFDQSLKRLQTDHVDVLHIHSLGNDDNLERIERGGLVEALYKLRDQKAARFIGVTSHTNPLTLKKALQRHDFDCTQMALNAALQGMKPAGTGDGKQVLNPEMGTSFEIEALPVAVEKGLGIIGMKTYGQEELLGPGSGRSTVEKLLRYTLSLPVAVVSVGMPKLEFIPHNVQMARDFTPMPKHEMEQFSRQMAAAYKLALDHKFAHHVDA
jgi:predicted aldo/keto reductase-like oxidoreductase